MRIKQTKKSNPSVQSHVYLFKVVFPHAHTSRVWGADIPAEKPGIYCCHRVFRTVIPTSELPPLLKNRAHHVRNAVGRSGEVVLSVETLLRKRPSVRSRPAFSGAERGAQWG